MKRVSFDDVSYIAASHEDVNSPGVWKKILFQKGDLQCGTIQMVNWAKLPAGRRFAPHYHEDMQELFVILSGEVELTVDGENAVLRRGDAVIVEARENHSMVNESSVDVEYLAIGVAAGTDGKTVVT